MRKILGLLILTALLSCNSGKDGKMKLTGQIKNVKDGVVILNKCSDFINAVPIDSTEIINGKFSFNIYVQDTNLYSFFIKPSNIEFRTVLENSRIIITGDVENSNKGFMNVEVKGSYNDSLFNVGMNISKKIANEPQFEKLKLLQKKYQLEKDNDKKWEIKTEIHKYSTELRERAKRQKIKFIQKYPESFAAETIFHFMYLQLPLEEIKTIFEFFPEYKKNKGKLRIIHNEILSRERLQPGMTAPDFTIRDVKGEEVSLSTYRGKYVLLDFWASWCKPCRESFPHLKKAYAKYNDKGFEILGISIDSNHDSWKQAIKEDNIEWIHLIDNQDVGVGNLYAVHFVPSTYLINKEGIIIKKITDPHVLDKWLEDNL